MVERKTLDDLSGRIADGTLAFVMADLAATPRAAVVVEARYGDLFDVEHVQAGFLEPGDIVTLYEDGKWKNRAHGNRRATSVHDTQDEALEEGERLAHERGVVHHTV